MINQEENIPKQEMEKLMRLLDKAIIYLDNTLPTNPGYPYRIALSEAVKNAKSSSIISSFYIEYLGKGL